MARMTRRLAVWAAVVAALLMIPLLGRWPWTVLDFVAGGALLFGSALAYELATRNAHNPRRRMAVAVAVAAIALYVWAELAVGVFSNIGS